MVVRLASCISYFASTFRTRMNVGEKLVIRVSILMGPLATMQNPTSIKRSCTREEGEVSKSTREIMCAYLGVTQF